MYTLISVQMSLRKVGKLTVTLRTAANNIIWLRWFRHLAVFPSNYQARARGICLILMRSLNLTETSPLLPECVNVVPRRLALCFSVAATDVARGIYLILLKSSLKIGFLCYS